MTSILQSWLPASHLNDSLLIFSFLFVITQADELSFNPEEAGLPPQLSAVMLGAGMGQRELEVKASQDFVASGRDQLSCKQGITVLCRAT